MVAGLVSTLRDRGFVVSTVKHAHQGFDVDKPGTDSYAHRQAGAHEVALVSGKRWVLMHEMRDENEPTLDDILAKLAPCDIVIIEGFKSYRHPKIEATRSKTKRDQPIWPNDPSIVAIASDYKIEKSGRREFDLNDISGITDFVLEHLKIAQS
jgi:molybdopterin-guanine dinucleotide biosynthesis protein B